VSRAASGVHTQQPKKSTANDDTAALTPRIHHPQSQQVKVAEHILTGHKVAIKILNRRKIQAMDMEEKGELRLRLLWLVLYRLLAAGCCSGYWIV